MRARALSPTYFWDQNALDFYFFTRPFFHRVRTSNKTIEQQKNRCQGVWQTLLKCFWIMTYVTFMCTVHRGEWFAKQKDGNSQVIPPLLEECNHIFDLKLFPDSTVAYNLWRDTAHVRYSLPVLFRNSPQLFVSVIERGWEQHVSVKRHQVRHWRQIVMTDLNFQSSYAPSNFYGKCHIDIIQLLVLARWSIRQWCILQSS